MLKAAFYGDDFTGSTDALLQFERCGLRAILLVDLPPTDELRDLATRYDVIGVAGIARSLAPDEQEAEIRPILTALRDLNPRVVQYKICSTADSSPQLGSIGRALEVGRSIFGPAVVPILAAQPDLGRYTVFSHHFAAEAGTIHRLDRQPTMASHPATPMPESDLRLHLATQTDLHIDALHLTSYADLPHTYTRSTAHAVILDALTDTHLHLLGQTLTAPSNNPPLFTIGSGGLSRALALNLAPASSSSSDRAARPTRSLQPRSPALRDPSQVLVVSGSQSRRTREQIEHAVRSGWASFDLHDPTGAPQAAIAGLSAGTPGVIVHTGALIDQPTDTLVASLGKALATAAHEILNQTEVRRLVIAGGDTSGRVVRHLKITALELLPTPTHPIPNHPAPNPGRNRPAADCPGPNHLVPDHPGRNHPAPDHPGSKHSAPSHPGPTDLGPGTALCRAISRDATIDGLQVLLKGGQIGAPSLFEDFRTTRPATITPDGT